MQIGDFVEFLSDAQDAFGEDAWVSFIVDDFEIPGPDAQLVDVKFTAPDDTADDYVVLSISPNDNGHQLTLSFLAKRALKAQFEFVSGRFFLSLADEHGNTRFADDVLAGVSMRFINDDTLVHDIWQLA